MEEGEKRGVGRPSEYKEEFNDQARKQCLLYGATDKDLANFFEVCEATINNWKNDHPEFLESIRAGKDIADMEIANSLYNLAKGYDYKEEQAFKLKVDQYKEEIEVVEVSKHKTPDPVAIKFWLTNRRRNWRDKQETGFTNADGEDVPAVTVFQLPDNGRNNNG